MWFNPGLSMSEKERPSYLPELPITRPQFADYVPDLPTPPKGPEPSPPPAIVLSPDAAVPPEPSASTGGTETPEQPGRERLTLAGRVGAAPTVRTTPKGTLVARFPLGVHEDSGATTWHTIIAFNQRAEQVRTSVKRGDAVEVIGYRHTRILPARQEGRPPKEVVEVYATVVKPR